MTLIFKLIHNFSGIRNISFAFIAKIIYFLR
jgi:hypothetical protein